MPQEPDNTEKQQPENIDGLTNAGAAEDRAEEAANGQTDDVQALVEAAETAAAAPVPDTSSASATEDSAETGSAAAPDDDPMGKTADAPGGASAVPGEINEAAIQEVLAAAEQSAVSSSPGQTDAGGEAPAPTNDPAATEQTAPDSAGQEDSARAATPELAPDTAPFEPPPFDSGVHTDHTSQLDMLDDVELEVKVELGRTEMYIEDVLGLGAGSVVELDKGAGDPVDILVNERLVARGEVLVLNDSFCVRINDILSPVPELDEE